MIVARALMALALLAFWASSARAADVTGSWKLAVGSAPPCAITLNADGSATGDCATGNRVARWRVAADKLELRTASGETVGILTAKDGGFAGKKFSNGKTLALSR